MMMTARTRRRVGLVLMPLLAALSLSACADRRNEVALATAADVQAVSSRVSQLETDLRAARQAAEKAQASAERAEAANERMSALYRNQQQK